MEKQYLRYEGDSQIKNTDLGDRGRQRQVYVTWGAPRTLRERKDWGKRTGPRRKGEPVPERTYSDVRRIDYESRKEIRDVSTVDGNKKNRLQRELRRDNVLEREDHRNARSAVSIYVKSMRPKVHSRDNETSSSKHTPYRTKVTRAMRQKCWGRGELHRRDTRGNRKVGDRSLRTEVSQAGGVCLEYKYQE